MSGMEPEMTILQNQLEASTIFSSFSKKTLKELEELAILKRYRKQEQVVGQGEKWSFLVMVHSGKMDAIKDSPEGRSLVAATFNPGDVFWGLSFFDEQHLMPATLVAQENLALYLWHKESLLPYILKEGKVSWELTRLVVERLLMASEKLNEMTFQPVGVRLAKFLVGISKDEIGTPIERSLTLDEMAARIGTTREMVCRFLHKFSAEGLIDITRTEFTVKNPEALKRMIVN
jgi:CRP/FNR family transcriptional regulator